jgi:hypothetical protein
MFTTNIILAFKVLSRGSGVLSQVSFLKKLKCIMQFINLNLEGICFMNHALCGCVYFSNKPRYSFIIGVVVWFLIHVSSAWAIYFFMDCVCHSTMASTYKLNNYFWIEKINPAYICPDVKLIIYLMNWSANCIVLIYQFNYVTMKRHDGYKKGLKIPKG